MIPQDRCAICGDVDTPQNITYNMGLCRRCAPDALREMERTFARWRHEEELETANEIHINPKGVTV